MVTQARHRLRQMPPFRLTPRMVKVVPTNGLD
jgi:hypothetical protein